MNSYTRKGRTPITFDRVETRRKLECVTGKRPSPRCNEIELLRLCEQAGIEPVDFD